MTSNKSNSYCCKSCDGSQESTKARVFTAEKIKLFSSNNNAFDKIEIYLKKNYDGTAVYLNKCVQYKLLIIAHKIVLLASNQMFCLFRLGICCSTAGWRLEQADQRDGCCARTRSCRLDTWRTATKWRCPGSGFSTDPEHCWRS